MINNAVEFNLYFNRLRLGVDGYMSSAMLYSYIKELNSNIDIKPLFHKGKTHGLDDKDIMQALTTCAPSLLIIPDASGSEKDYVTLKKLGYEILCLDHHQTKPSKLAVTINNQHSENVNKDGAGANVVFQFLRALDDAFGVRNANHYIGMCAIGNIGDVMDMTNMYNRTINYYGLRNMNNPFLKELCYQYLEAEINPHEISFKIVPKINAVIRSDDNKLKEDIFYALIGERNDSECGKIAFECGQYHKKQKRNVNTIAKDIEQDITGDEKVIIVPPNYDIPQSYTGLIAGRISGDYNKPCVLVKENMIGSARSPVPIRETLAKGDGVAWASGHNEAFGIKLNDLKKFSDYCNTIDISTDIVYDCIYSGDISTIPLWLYGYFNKYRELYGKGIPKPQFHIKDIIIDPNAINFIGKSKSTIDFTYKGIKFIKFFVGQRLKDELGIEVGKVVKHKDICLDIIGDLEINQWGGGRTPQVVIDKIEKKEINFDDLW